MILLASTGIPCAFANAPIVVNASHDAASWAVNPVDCDVSPGLDICTVRAAVQLANSRSGMDTIELPWDASLVLEIGGSGDASVGDLDITDDLVIRTVGGHLPQDTGRLPTIDASALGQRILDVASGVSVSIEGVRFTGADHNTEGGAIRNAGQLLLETVEFTGNRGAFGGGAVHSAGAGSFLDVRDSHFEANHVIGASSGAAIQVAGGTARIRRSSFLANASVNLSAPTVAVLSGSDVEISDSTLDGDLVNAASVGVRATSPAALALRNVTVRDFEETSLRITGLNVNAPVDIAHSILDIGDDHLNSAACEIHLAGSASHGNVRVANSVVVARDVGCARYYDNVIDADPQLAPTLSSAPFRVTRHARLLSLDSPAVDLGLAPGEVAVPAAQACTSSDGQGHVRPQDGSLDMEPRCDAGAWEWEHDQPAVHIVNSASDHPDVDPGDGECDSSVALDGLQCTLRAAVMEANARPGIDAVRFQPGFEASVVLVSPPANDASGGDLDVVDDVLIDGDRGLGLGSITLEQSPQGERHFEFDLPEGARAWLKNMHLAGGASAPLSGGAVRIRNGDVRMEQVELSNNSAETDGGAISVVAGSLDLIDSDVYANQAPGRGAAIFVGSDAYATILRSSLWNNSAGIDDSPVAALHVAAGGYARVETSTIHENSAGIEGNSADTLSLSHVTVTDNDGPGVRAKFSAQLNYFAIAASVVSGNGGGDCVLMDVDQPDSTVIFDMWNLFADGSCVVGNSFSADPLLEPLNRPEGRLSRVRLPINDPIAGLYSPVIDVAPCLDLKNGRGTDQRGAPVPSNNPDVVDGGGSCDVGAVESVTLPIQEAVFQDGFED